jgi:hypothetical protein
MAVAIALALVVVSTVVAVTYTKRGKAVTAVATVTATAFHSSEAIHWEDMPSTSTTITVPSSQKALLIVTFSGEVNCDQELQEDESCLVRVLVDDAVAAPGEVIFDSNADNYASSLLEAVAWETNSMQFVAGPVKAGTHTVTVQWRVNGSDSTFKIKGRTLTVLRAKV